MNIEELRKELKQKRNTLEFTQELFKSAEYEFECCILPRNKEESINMELIELEEQIQIIKEEIWLIESEIEQKKLSKNM